MFRELGLEVSYLRHEHGLRGTTTNDEEYASWNHRHRRNLAQTRAGLSRTSATKSPSAPTSRRSTAENSPQQYGCEFVPDIRGSLPSSPSGLRGRLHVPRFPAAAARRSAREAGKHVQVQKPISTDLETAREMIDIADRAGIRLGVVSQHRFDDSIQFLKRAIPAGPAGKDPAGRRLREVVSHSRLLFAADQG